MTNCTTMIDQEMREVKPVFLGDEPHQILLNLDRIGIGGPAQESREASNMRIYDKAFNDAEGVAQHHVGGLPGYARQRQQFLHRRRHFTAVLCNEALAGGADIPGFVAIEAGWSDILLQLFLADCGIIFYVTILLK